jgi:virginiamycin B lyase
MRRLLIVIAMGLTATVAGARDQENTKAGLDYQLTTKVIQLPEGARPHDAAPGRPGEIWYTAQRQGALGIIDIAGWTYRQVPLGEGSSPHGVVLGPDGNAWITDGGQNAIVRYDPGTENIDVWKLPEDAGYTNLNTGAFDKDGVHWFTGQNGIYGKVDPSGQVQVWQDPEGRGPYGIDDTPDGEIWYVSLAGSHLAKVNRADGTVDMIEPPHQGAGLRRVWADSKGNLWITGWNSGKLYRYRPQSDEWTTFDLPGEKPQAYAVYVDERDDVWVTDFASNNTLVFDPDLEKWIATIPGSGPNAQVRQILGRGSEVYLPESGTDRLMLVTVGG